MYFYMLELPASDNKVCHHWHTRCIECAWRTGTTFCSAQNKHLKHTVCIHGISNTTKMIPKKNKKCVHLEECLFTCCDFPSYFSLLLWESSQSSWEREQMRKASSFS